VLLAVKIRLTRRGARKKPFYRVVVADAKMPRDGRFIEIVGTYNPLSEPSEIKIEKKKVEKWLKRGAIPTRTVEKLLSIAGIETK